MARRAHVAAPERCKAVHCDYISSVGTAASTSDSSIGRAPGLHPGGSGIVTCSEDHVAEAEEDDAPSCGLGGIAVSRTACHPI